MRTSSAKAKGRRLQQWLAQRLLALRPSLTEQDVQSTPMGCTGADIKLSQEAQKQIPFQFECKNAEGWKKAYDVMEQANWHGDYPAIAVIKSNRKNPIVIMDWDTFEGLIK